MFLFLNSFKVSNRRFIKLNPMQMMATTAKFNKGVDILSRDFELTPPLKERIDKKIGKVLSKLGSQAISTHVCLRVHKFSPIENHSHVTKKDSQIVEVTVRMKGGVVINVSERTEDMYSTVGKAILNSNTN